MVVGEVKRSTNIMDGIENTGDVRLHDHRLRLKQRFDIVRKLGQGTYGKVQLGINKKTGQEVAIKTIKKCKIESEADLIRIRREVQIMSSVRHPNIVHIYEVFENSEKMILVMEYCSGGELYDYLSQKKVLQEEEARRLFRQIATAVYYCHIHKICHRDLKLENVLLDHTGSAKIADFGLSNVFKETSLLSTFCGSPLYASPEIVKGTPYIGPEVDCWSLGVLLYTLVYGAMPFDGSNFKRLVRQISNGDYYEPKNPSSASPLIRDMLTVDPLKRADIAYICDNPWVNAGCETSCLEMAELLAAETPVRLDLLLSLAPAAPSNSNSVVVPSSEQAELGPEESGADLTSSASMAVEPSNSAEKRILELVAEGGEDAIKPSPTRTIVSASDNKRKLELAMSASGLQRKKERVASCASISPQAPVPEETSADTPPEPEPETSVQPGLKSSATITIAPSPAPEPAPAPSVTAPAPAPLPAPKPVKEPAKGRATSTPREKTKEEKPEKKEEPKTPAPVPAPKPVKEPAKGRATSTPREKTKEEKPEKKEEPKTPANTPAPKPVKEPAKGRATSTPREKTKEEKPEKKEEPKVHITRAHGPAPAPKPVKEPAKGRATSTPREKTKEEKPEKKEEPKTPAPAPKPVKEPAKGRATSTPREKTKEEKPDKKEEPKTLAHTSAPAPKPVKEPAKGRATSTPREKTKEEKPDKKEDPKTPAHAPEPKPVKEPAKVCATSTPREKTKEEKPEKKEEPKVHITRAHGPAPALKPVKEPAKVRATSTPREKTKEEKPEKKEEPKTPAHALAPKPVKEPAKDRATSTPREKTKEEKPEKKEEPKTLAPAPKPVKEPAKDRATSTPREKTKEEKPEKKEEPKTPAHAPAPAPKPVKEPAKGRATSTPREKTKEEKPEKKEEPKTPAHAPAPKPVKEPAKVRGTSTPREKTKEEKPEKKEEPKTLAHASAPAPKPVKEPAKGRATSTPREKTKEEKPDKKEEPKTLAHASAPAPKPVKEPAKGRATSTPREKTKEEKPEKEEPKVEETKPSAVASAADKLTSLSLSQPTPANQTPVKPKKLSIPGGNVGSFKDQFERRASLTSPPEPKRIVPKPVVSKIAKPKAQSEERESAPRPEPGSVRLQQIGIEPSPTPTEEPSRGGVKKTESEPSHGTPAVDPSVLLQDARRSLQNSMAKLVEEKAGEENRRRAARDIISTAIRTGKPPVPYGRSSSAGVASLVSPPGTPPAAPSSTPRVFRTEAQHRVEDHRNSAIRAVVVASLVSPPGTPPAAPSSTPRVFRTEAQHRVEDHLPYGRSSSAGVASLVSPPGTPPAAPSSTPRVFRTEAQHRVEDHRNRGVSVERIIPIHVAEEAPAPVTPPTPKPAPPATPPAAPRPAQTPLRRLVSSESSASEACSSPGEPIKKSAREFIIPIAVEGKGYVTPRQRSLEPEAASTTSRVPRTPKPRRISSLVSGGESEEEDDTHMHRLRSTRAARAESVSSGEEDEEDEGFHLLTAENLFSTLLHRVRALTNRLNGEEGPGFPHHPHSLFNNLQSPFFNSPHLPRRHLFREGWGARDLHANFDSMFNKPRHAPRGGSKKSKEPRARADDGDALDLSDLDLSAIQFSEREMRALSGLTPALSRRLQRQLLAHLPPRAATRLRRTLSLRDPAADPADPAADPATSDPAPADPPPSAPDRPPGAERSVSLDLDTESSLAQFCTLPRLRRRSSASREKSPPGEAAPPPREPPEPRSRPLLSKYLTPERALSLDDSSHSSEGSVPSEPRRHSMRLAGEPARRRVSRFLRSDFFDAPPDENALARRRKEKELETQKILREIREKRNRSLEAAGVASPTEADDPARKCLSPVSLLGGKERSRSNTPFFPILDNIKETAADTSPAATRERRAAAERPRSRVEDSLGRESRLTRPRSYPVKNLDAADEPGLTPAESNEENECQDKSLQRESKLIRPKSYPASSPSPEKVYISRTLSKRDEPRAAADEESRKEAGEHVKGDGARAAGDAGGAADVEVSFSITLPKKKPEKISKLDSLEICEPSPQTVETAKVDGDKSTSDTLVVRKYQIINSADDKPDQKIENGIVSNGGSKDIIDKANLNADEAKTKQKATTNAKKDEVKAKTDGEAGEKKGTIKKKIIRKVSSKSKTELGSSQDAGEGKAPTEKKKVTKKVKEKPAEDGTKPGTVTKKKSVLQSIGHKLEKFTSTKSSSPEKGADSGAAASKSTDNSKVSRTQREQSVPVTADPPTESNLIKRAVTLTDVAALETQPANNTKTTVSKVLGLFKKFEPKEKPSKPPIETSLSENLEKEKIEINNLASSKPDIVAELISESAEKDKPRRPTSLLLNGLSRKNKYGRTASDSVSAAYTETDDPPVLKKDEPKNLRNTLKLDFSRLPRVKKIVPTNPVIEPHVMNLTSEDKDAEKKSVCEKNGTISDGISNIENEDAQSRSRSRSRSTVSNSELKSDLSAEGKPSDKYSVSPSETTAHHPLRNRESTTPEKEDIVDRIRRKSFYSRFNEKKQRRKSSLVGPGAAEYDPLARIHSPPAEPKLDASPTSPGIHDLSPGYSVASDLSPSTERYRTLLTDLSISNRNNIRYDNHGLNDKIDTYRSLDRNDFRKYPGSRSYLDYDQPTSYGTHRYSRTKSLLDDGPDEPSLGQIRDPLKYSRTLSMYSPGSYATYRPKRTTRNSAIILKESEKEPSPENILEKIRQRKKISISVTRKPDPEKDPLPRSTVSPKGEGDGAERSEKAD
ncbi:microtubule-associated protein futsch [Ostrinia nubilalis]|uniref:microtubule-associated protein futsch n=1 Tax=Ostrinia nubilalis TaxID=29057 RepID=UPI0030822082